MAETDPADIVKDILVAAGVGTLAADSGWCIDVGAEADSPDTFITIAESGGEDPNPRWLLNFPSISVVVRGAPNGYPAMYAKAVDVVNALLGYPSTDFGDTRLVSLRQIGGITFLGFDQEKKPRVSTNWSLITEPGVGTHRESL